MKGLLITVAIAVGLYLLISVASRPDKSTYSEVSTWEGGKQKTVSSYTAPPREVGPNLKVKIQKSIYEFGYLKVTGVVENVGDKPAFSPRIVVKVYGTSLRTLLAEDTTSPAGMYLKNMGPGSSPAFESIESVPGEPDDVKYEVVVGKYDFDVTYPKI